jgi:hypothetical protein
LASRGPEDEEKQLPKTEEGISKVEVQDFDYPMFILRIFFTSEFDIPCSIFDIFLVFPGRIEGKGENH